MVCSIKTLVCLPAASISGRYCAHLAEVLVGATNSVDGCTKSDCTTTAKRPPCCSWPSAPRAALTRKRSPRTEFRHVSKRLCYRASIFRVVGQLPGAQQNLFGQRSLGSLVQRAPDGVSAARPPYSLKRGQVLFCSVVSPERHCRHTQMIDMRNTNRNTAVRSQLPSGDRGGRVAEVIERGPGAHQDPQFRGLGAGPAGAAPDNGDPAAQVQGHRIW